MLTAFTTLLWINWNHGFTVFMEKPMKQTLSKIFIDQIESMKTLEDSLCDYKEFGFEKRVIDLDMLESDDYKIGKALVLQTDYIKQSKGWWNLFNKYEEKTLKALKFNPEISTYVETTMAEIAKKVTQSLSNAALFNFFYHHGINILMLNINPGFIFRCPENVKL